MTMKKYRLIEHDPNYNNRVVATADSIETIAEEMAKRYTSGCYYAVEPFEESIMDRVKSYEDACEVLGIKPIEATSMCTYDRLDARYHFESDIPDHIEALLKLETITAALNEGWKPDWEGGQEKWYVEIDINGKTHIANSINKWGSYLPRLYFKSRELAEYAAKQFAELYKQLLIERF